VDDNPFRRSNNPQALEDRWHPKTTNSARGVPFDVSLRIELCIERFADQFTAFGPSRSAINRRVNDSEKHSNQWTLLVGTLVVVYSLSLGSYGSPPVQPEASR
jgi:hypothetical protein